MRTMILFLVIGAASLGTTALTPSKAEATWPRYYAGYYPAYSYYPVYYPAYRSYYAPVYTPPVVQSYYYAPPVVQSYYYAPAPVVVTPSPVIRAYYPGAYYYP
ncbi:MAG: hypothetical protein K2R98_19125 [Gemmataceae bacterium]|nr:hypothetical protein [Gemmataceae bacterium]